MTKIVGINLAKNGSLAIVQDGVVEFYLEEERVTRVKRDVSAETLANKYIDSSVDVVTICDCFTRYNKQTFRERTEAKNKLLKIVRSKGIPFVDYRKRHHECHAASVWYTSPFEDSAVVVMDGKGSYHDGYCEVESIYDNMTPVFKHYSTFYSEEESALEGEPHWIDGNLYSNRTSIGQAFRRVSRYCGFDEIEAGKTMGLSAYGSGDINLFNEEYGHSLCSTQLKPEGNTTAYVGPKLQPEDLAYNLQKSAERHTLFMIRKAIELTNKKNVCVSGGFFLNCVSNYSILKNTDVNLYVDPIAYDGGIAIGSALLEYYEHFCDRPRPHRISTVLA